MVSAIGLGAMSFAGVYGNASEAECAAVLDAAHAAGMDFIDTSNVYGMGLSESIIGRHMAATGQRFVIATKGGICNDGTRRWFDNSAGHLRAELEGSLGRLGVSSVALYYIHRRDQGLPIETVMETLLGFQAEGLIGGIGFSEIAPASLRRAAAVGPVAAVQSEYSLMTRLPDLGLIRACAEVGAAFVPFSPLARGLFSDTPPELGTLSATDFRRSQPRFSGENLPRNMTHVRALQGLARDRGVSTAALALAWVLAQGSHLIPIPGTKSAAHLAECIAGGKLSLSAADLIAIDRVMPVGFAHGDRYSDSQWVGPEAWA
jgi:aryl-alcohol dehydrogenase-like predicted oxidoreductase